MRMALGASSQKVTQLMLCANHAAGDLRAARRRRTRRHARDASLIATPVRRVHLRDRARHRSGRVCRKPARGRGGLPAGGLDPRDPRRPRRPDADAATGIRQIVQVQRPRRIDPRRAIAGCARITSSSDTPTALSRCHSTCHTDFLSPEIPCQNRQFREGFYTWAENMAGCSGRFPQLAHPCSMMILSGVRDGNSRLAGHGQPPVTAGDSTGMPCERDTDVPGIQLSEIFVYTFWTPIE